MLQSQRTQRRWADGPRRVRRRCGGATVAVLLALAHVARGHDSWLVSSASSAGSGEEVWLAFVTGEVFPMGEAATDPARVAAFVDVVGEERQEVRGYAPEDKGLAARRRLQDGGFHVIGCALRPRLLEMKAEDFDKYLASEQADDALAERREEPSAGPVTERYTKYAKTIVEVRPIDEADLGYQTPVGHRLEIIPLSNPCQWQVATTVQVQVLLDGHPWPGVAISVGHEGLGIHEYAARGRTDLNGIAPVKLTRPGQWFIKAHHIRRAGGVRGFDWESLWASLTFRVQGRLDVEGEIQAVRAVHGEVSPWAAVGYRMGKAAARTLGAPAGGRGPSATCHVPLARPYVEIVDGVQAATGASVGTLTLRVEPADFADMRVVFGDESAGRWVAVPADALPAMIDAAPPQDAASLAVKIMSMPDPEVFVILRLEGEAEGEGRKEVQSPPSGEASGAARGSSP